MRFYTHAESVAQVVVVVYFFQFAHRLVFSGSLKDYLISQANIDINRIFLYAFPVNGVVSRVLKD